MNGQIWSLLATDAQIDPSQNWACLLLPALAVAIVSALFQLSMSRQIAHLEARLASRTGFFLRKLQAHEELWPLVAACNRAQSSLARLKEEGHDLSQAAKEIGDRRKVMKNFVYDKGLYFDETVRRLIQELDGQLGDPHISEVRAKTEEVEEKLREIICEIT